MGWFRKQSSAEAERVDPAEFRALQRQLAELQQSIASTPPTAPDNGPTDSLDDRIDELVERLTDTDEAARQAAERVSAIDQRVAGMGTELTNQLTELGRDIDALADLPSMQPGSANGGPSAEAIGELHDGQVKLAEEQARYQIAFREDLAALAEQIRRHAPR